MGNPTAEGVLPCQPERTRNGARKEGPRVRSVVPGSLSGSPVNHSACFLPRWFPGHLVERYRLHPFVLLTAEGPEGLPPPPGAQGLCASGSHRALTPWVPTAELRVIGGRPLGIKNTELPPSRSTRAVGKDSEPGRSEFKACLYHLLTVIRGRLLSLAEPWFPGPLNGDINTRFIGILSEYSKICQVQLASTARHAVGAGEVTAPWHGPGAFVPHSAEHTSFSLTLRVLCRWPRSAFPSCASSAHCPVFTSGLCAV